MSNVLDRIDRLTPSEIRSIATDLKECEGFERIMSGYEIRHVDQAEIRTLFAKHEFPISEEEVSVACQVITEHADHPLSNITFPEEIFPQELT